MAASQATEAGNGMLRLSSKIREDIFRAVLVVPHELYVFRDPGGPVEIFAPDRPRQWHSLLSTNRQIGREAAAVLYGKNTFNFLDTTSGQVDLLEAFLRCTGPLNAGLISHICVNFPAVDVQSSTSDPQQDGERTVQVLREHCFGLRTLELHVQGSNSSSLTKANEDDLDSVREALSGFGAKLRTLPSLKKVVVRFYAGHPTPSVMGIMQDLGWVVLPAHRN